MENIKKVVGVAFVEYGKLLIVQSKRSKTTNSYTLIGGGVEENERLVDACIREVKEEIHNNFSITEADLIPILGFKETALSDPNVLVEMSLYLCTKKIDVDLIPNDEILAYHWFEIGETSYNLSSSILNHFLPYAIEKGLIY